jgi:lipopolysaccharide transport system permease protein
MATETTTPPVTVIRPTHGWVSLRLKELWAFRELLYFFVWRDIKVRYKQTVVGIGWAVIQPLFMVLVFSLIFGTLAKIPSNDIPYPVYLYSAMLPWSLFATGLSSGSTSLVANQRLVTRVYFPRLVLPISAVLGSLVDFVVSFGVFIVLMLYLYGLPTLAIVTLPLFIAIALFAAIGIACWLSAIDARYRDVRYTLPFLTQVWYFATPIIYPVTFIPDNWRWILGLNPMTAVVEGFRWALLGQPLDIGFPLLLSLALVAILFVSGLFYFRRAERIFADTV